MFRIRLVCLQTEEKWVFRVGMGFRWANLGAGVALLVAGFLLETFWVPLVLASLAFLGALYEESAVFDRTSNRAEFRVGLVAWHRTRVVSLTDIAEVRVSSFGPARFTGLEVGLVDGRVLTIENDRGKPSSERLAAWGAGLAAWLGVPLVQ
jgi:hypothetical protein